MPRPSTGRRSCPSSSVDDAPIATFRAGIGSPCLQPRAVSRSPPSAPMAGSPRLNALTRWHRSGSREPTSRSSACRTAGCMPLRWGQRSWVSCHATNGVANAAGQSNCAFTLCPEVSKSRDSTKRMVFARRRSARTEGGCFLVSQGYVQTMLEGRRPRARCGSDRKQPAVTLGIQRQRTTPGDHAACQRWSPRFAGRRRSRQRAADRGTDSDAGRRACAGIGKRRQPGRTRFALRRGRA